MKLTRKYFPACLFLMFVCLPRFPAIAQHLQIRTYGTGEGLPQSEVFALMQDHAGHMWFGTYESGLARYDGKSMTPIAGLPHPSIRCLMQDRQGHVWIGTENGLACWQDDQILCTFGKAEGLPDDAINSLAQDSTGTIWAATSAGVAIWRGEFPGAQASSGATPFQKVFPPERDSTQVLAQALAVTSRNEIWLGTNTGLYVLTAPTNSDQGFLQQMSGDVRALLPARDGALWAGTASGLYRIAAGQIQAFKKTEGMRDEEIFCLAQDLRGVLWVGARTCLMKYEGRQFTAYDTRHGLPNAYIRSLLVDYEDNLWLGTVGGGVGKIYGWYLSNYTRENGQLPINLVFSFMQDRQDRIWIGTGGGGIAIVDGEKISILNSHNALPNDFVRGMVTTPQGEVWVATQGGAARLREGRWQIFTTQNGLPSDRLRHVRITPAGDLWFASLNGAIHYRDGRFSNLTMAEGLPSNSAHDVYQDHRGRLWIACDGGLALREGGTTRVFTTAEGLPDNNIYAIFEDHAGEMWFGTRAGGVAKFTGNGFDNINSHNGLPNDVVYFIAEDAQQRLWFGTNIGLACYDRQNFFYLGSANGLPNAECNTRAVMLDRQGYLWFGTVGGASRVETALLPATSPAPRVACEGIEVVGQREYAPGFDVLPVQGYNSTLILKFATLSFINEQEVKTKVLLEGFDKDWVEVGEARSIRYTNLSPQTYTFQVRGTNALGIPSAAAAQIRFEILPPFYRTYWFIGLSLAVIAGLVFGSHRWRMRHLQQQAEELTTAVSQKTQELQQASGFLNTVKEFLPLGLLVIDARRVIVDANREAEKLFEYGPGELKGLDFNNVISSPVASREAVWQTFLQKKSGIELVGMARRGKHFICEIHSDHVNDSSGRLLYLILTCENIGERKELEAKIIDNEKQLALYDLAAGMGDVLTQKLANVNTIIDALKAHLLSQDRSDTAQLLGNAETAIHDLRKVMAQLFEFTAYLGKVTTVSRDLREELSELVERWRGKIVIVLPLLPHPVPVRILAKFKDGLDEAAQNALDAEAQEVKIEVELLPSLSRVRLVLTDNGRGISPENVTKVFLPFFKTKDGHHTGLGLWKLHQVVKQSGGTVDIVAMPNGGTQLRITLPFDPRHEAAERRTPAPPVVR